MSLVFIYFLVKRHRRRRQRIRRELHRLLLHECGDIQEDQESRLLQNGGVGDSHGAGRNKGRRGWRARKNNNNNSKYSDDPFKLVDRFLPVHESFFGPALNHVQQKPITALEDEANNDDFDNGGCEQDEQQQQQQQDGDDVYDDDDPFRADEEEEPMFIKPWSYSSLLPAPPILPSSSSSDARFEI